MKKEHIRGQGIVEISIEGINYLGVRLFIANKDERTVLGEGLIAVCLLKTV